MGKVSFGDNEYVVEVPDHDWVAIGEVGRNISDSGVQVFWGAVADDLWDVAVACGKVGYVDAEGFIFASAPAGPQP